jgi:hypothetical protein
MQRSVHPSRCPPGLGFSAAPQRPYGTAGVVTRHSVARRSASASAAPLAVESKQGAFPPRAPRPHWPTAAALAACAALASALTAPPAAAAHAAAAPAAAALQPAGEWAARRLARAVLIPFATTWVAVAVLNHLAQQAEQVRGSFHRSSALEQFCNCRHMGEGEMPMPIRASGAAGVHIPSLHLPACNSRILGPRLALPLKAHVLPAKMRMFPAIHLQRRPCPPAPKTPRRAAAKPHRRELR